MSLLSDENPFATNPELNDVPAGSQIVDFLQTLVISLAIVIVTYLFIVTPNEVKGSSMRETFQDKESVITNKMIQVFGGNDNFIGKVFGDYKRGDVIVLHSQARGDDFIKRIIGVGGDKVMIKGGYVYVNGQQISEPYLADGTIDPSINNKGHTYTKNSHFQEGIEYIVPEGTYFCLGDNRENSVDSRFNELGYVKRSDMKGRVFFRYLPFNKFGIIKGSDYGFNDGLD